MMLWVWLIPGLAAAAPDDPDQRLFRVQMSMAQKGDAFAQYYLGEMFEQGLGTKQNLSEAFTWYEKSAAQQNRLAQMKLAKRKEIEEEAAREQAALEEAARAATTPPPAPVKAPPAAAAPAKAPVAAAAPAKPAADAAAVEIMKQQLLAKAQAEAKEKEKEKERKRAAIRALILKMSQDAHEVFE
jgi:hypothetical protein